MINDLDNIPVVSGVGKFDATKYEGFRVPIASVTKEHVIDNFPKDASGQGVYTPNSTTMKWVVRVVTNPLPELNESGAPGKIIEISQEDGSTKKITPSHDFNLQETFDPVTKQMEVAISKHPKAALWNFMRKMGVQKLSELQGKIVTLTAKPSKREGDDRVFLAIVI